MPPANASPPPTRNISSGHLELGEWIRTVRLAEGISQRELAERSGLSRSYVCDIERGRGTHPSVMSMDKLALALGASRTDLMKAAGMLERAGPDRESDEERRMLALYRDLNESGRAQVMRFIRFVHTDEHAWRQPSFVDVLSLGDANRGRPGQTEMLPLFGDVIEGD